MQPERRSTSRSAQFGRRRLSRDAGEADADAGAPLRYSIPTTWQPVLKQPLEDTLHDGWELQTFWMHYLYARSCCNGGRGAANLEEDGNKMSDVSVGPETSASEIYQHGWTQSMISSLSKLVS